MIVFTNGCFDIIHPGHVDLLTKARSLGSKLIVGINSDRSVRAIKGADRPLQNEDARRAVLLGLKAVDEVVIFDELTPERIIREIQPDVLVKGGDWQPEEIVGSSFVLGRGGQVHSIPLTEGYSTSGVIRRLDAPAGDGTAGHGNQGTIRSSLDEHIGVMAGLMATCGEEIDRAAAIICDTLNAGAKVLTCGNGGSAADAQHIAAELVGRYERERRALPAIALTTDTSALTALANDYDFASVFSRQVEALANEGDCLIALSTSGNSPNVVRAVMAAREKKCRIIGMTGADGKKLAALSDASVMVPSARTARIQEAHITVAHIWCEMVENSLKSS